MRKIDKLNRSPAYIEKKCLGVDGIEAMIFSMHRVLFALLLLSSVVLSSAQNVRPVDTINRADLPGLMSFEREPAGDTPAGWAAGPSGTIFQDNKIVHSGHGAVRLERNPQSTGGFSTINQVIDIDFAGSTLELRGFLRTENVSEFAGLWMREDGEQNNLAFDNMEGQNLKGTTEWKEYSIVLPLKPEARKLNFGVLLVGTGKAWADDLQLLVDGKPVAQAAKIERPKTIFELDTQFDKGSGIAMNDLSKVQIENLVTLGKVWGFLKYHHPLITSGKKHWDYELFRILPKVLNAQDHATANKILATWVAGLGEVPPCQPCVRLDPKNLELAPDLDWTRNEALLGSELSQSLRSIYRNRLAGQFYLARAQNGNPGFRHELDYARVKLPDFGFQLLALYRFWNIIEYWFPYRDVIGENRDNVLAEFIPRVALAKDAESYTRELMAAIGRAHDGHANLWRSLQLRPPAGKCQLPVKVRFIEDRPVVTEVLSDTGPKEGSLAVGDAITDLDGTPVAKLLEKWLPYYVGSNDAARLRDLGQVISRGECGETSVGIERGKQHLAIKARREEILREDFAGFHDLPGEGFRLLSKDIAYLKLSAVKSSQAVHYVEAAAGTKGLIIDIRNYPSEFMVFALGALLVDKPSEFSLFTQGDLSNPGAFYWSIPVSLTPEKPHYSGKVIILVDEVSMSQAEYTTMAFRVAPGAVVVGSTTSGADGDVSAYSLPGAIYTAISGLGVFYPDKRPTQRIGIVPDVKVRPTIAGVKAGKDEVLEEAIRQVLGPDTPSAEIEKMYKKPATSGN